MRYFSKLLIALLPLQAFALTCPNNNNILMTGQSIEQVIQACGQPTSRNESEQTTKLSEEWVYYIPDKRHQTNDKVTMTFNDGKLSNINVVKTHFKNGSKCEITNNQGKRITIPCSTTEMNLTTFTNCHRLIKTTNFSSYIWNACGRPAEMKTTASKTVKVDDLTYEGSTPPNTLEFRDGKLAGWKY